jgi:hypothetical protein
MKGGKVIGESMIFSPISSPKIVITLFLFNLIALTDLKFSKICEFSCFNHFCRPSH